MLVLNRVPKETVVRGNDIEIKILSIANDVRLDTTAPLFISILVSSCTKNPSQEFQDKSLNLSNPPPKRFTQIHGNPIRPNQYFICDVNGLNECPVYTYIGLETGKTKFNKKLKGEK